MRKSKCTEEQIVAILKEGDAGVDVASLLRRHGISRATYYHWRSKYAGTTPSELKRMKELEAENGKLKRMYAELALEILFLTVLGGGVLRSTRSASTIDVNSGLRVSAPCVLRCCASA